MCTTFRHWTQFFTLLMLSSKLIAQNSTAFSVSDFQVNTTGGAPFNLYAVLAQQKIVILSFVSTNTTAYPNSWSYYASGALSELYTAHGPAGDQLVEVLMVEGDPSTMSSELTPWSTPYPKVSSSTLAQTFNITNFPTNVIICPNKKGFKVPPLGAVALWEEAQQCPVAKGEHNIGIFEVNWGTEATDICVDINVNPSFKLINLGNEPLTSCLLETLWGDEVVSTINWTGQLQRFDEAVINLDPVLLTNPGTLKIKASAPNGQPDLYPEENERSQIFTAAPNMVNNNVALYLRTDSYGYETYWEIRNAAQQVVQSGGNTCVGPNGGGIPINYEPGCNAYQNNTTTLKYFFLSDGCYTIHIVDAFGDGICCQNGQGSFKLYNFVYNGTSQSIVGDPILNGGAFKTNSSHGFSVGTLLNSTTSTSLAATSVKLSPNPASDQVNIECSVPFNRIFVNNALGQPIYISENDTNPTLNTTNWPSGWYHVALYHNNAWVGTQQLIVR
jgi:Secretion system C-terminal sorting domain